MSFLRRGYPKPKEPKEHECPLPRWRWLPLLVWPRWREGARWTCDAAVFTVGCGAVWEYQKYVDLIASPYTDTSGYYWFRLPKG